MSFEIKPASAPATVVSSLLTSVFGSIGLGIAMSVIFDSAIVGVSVMVFSLSFITPVITYLMLKGNLLFRELEKK